MGLQSDLLDWYRSSARDLPWRRTSDPYAVLVSEFMLQQTTVAAVIPKYESWMARFPDFKSLAAASTDEVLEMWQGLGYYQRARRLHALAQIASEKGTPESLDEWRSLPGIGPYTAAAVASISQGAAVPLVDGNVVRVFSRLTNDDSPWPLIERRAWDWAAEILVRESPGEWNQALMELGATICTPKNPGCLLCPVRQHCRGSFRTNELPGPKPKPDIIEMESWIFAPRFQALWGIRQIPMGEWWEGMWEMPRSITGPYELIELLGDPALNFAGRFTHTVTRHRIRAEVQLAELATPVESLRWVTDEEIDRLALPSPQRRALRLARNVKK